MLSYRHGFHAGNFADVLKHLVLVQILAYLAQKDKAFSYIETHAGPGIYPLDAGYALKNREFDNGIGKLWQRDDLPECLADYVKVIKHFNPTARLNVYPGSPLIAQHLLRPYDRLVLCELHPSEIKLLGQSLGKHRQVTVVHDDGLKHAIGLLPPRERRGLVLIDPAYEVKSDYHQVCETLAAMHKRFATGTYALWYPVVERQRSQHIERTLQNSGIKNIELFELGLMPDAEGQGMTACGMIVINPPWTLVAQMRQALPWLAEVLGEEGVSFYRMQTLAGE
jgi:23S rRNA (adenine2030-N6)-methyltransferase